MPILYSPLPYQNLKRSLLSRKVILLFSILIALSIYYRSLVEFTYKINIDIPSDVSPVSPVSPVNNVNHNDSQKIDDVDLLSTEEHQNKFRVNLDGLKKKYQVSDILRIVIEPRHPSLVKKLKTSYFRVQVTGPTIYSPELVSSSNSSVLVFEAPLMDQGTYKMQARIVFYDFPGIYTLNSKYNLPRIPKLDLVIVNGEFTFKVEQSPDWGRLKPQLPDTCADIPILRGRWKENLSQFMPYNCLIPQYKLPDVLETNNVKVRPKFVDYDNLPFRYTWIRLLGDSNGRRIFSLLKQRTKSKCVWNSDGQNRDRKTQAICKVNYKHTQFYGEKDPRPREVYFTYDWYYPGTKYSFETLLNNTFEQVCEPFGTRGPCDLINPNNTASERICSVKQADYTFVSIGSHTPEWIDKNIDKYLDEIFQYLHGNYREKVTFLTTNAVNIRKIPNSFSNQHTIRNNYRIARANEILKSHVDRSREDGYNNIDLLDFYGATLPVWELSGDAVHYQYPIYQQQILLMVDKLVSHMRAIV